MISQGGKTIIQQFVTKTKDLLLQSTLATLQEKYGIWKDGHMIPVEKLSTKDTDDIHIARMLRERLKHIINSLPDETSEKERAAVDQLVAEQAFTILNRFCALRMCEERDLIFETVRDGYNSQGFLSYDAVTGGGSVGSQYLRYKWYLSSIYDELSVELPAVFDRYSQFCLVFPDETTLQNLLALINAETLTAFYDEQTGETINFWQEDETIGWIYQYYNSLEERRKIREESTRPRNSREMAIRNQFFTPDFVVKFLTDNTLGRIWYEMTGGQSHIYEVCEYMVRKPGEEVYSRKLKEPTEIRTLDPTCGSMHFGLYAYGLYEYIYLDAWDNQPTLLTEYRYSLTREEFKKKIPALILKYNIYGCEIDPRALQMAALSLWLRAQRSYNELQIPREDRPLITHSNLVLAEGMPGNKKMFNILLSELDAPMQRLIKKIWEKMRFVGEAGLLIRMEQEIEKEIEDLRKNWSKVAKSKDLDMFSATLEHDIEESIKAVQLSGKEAKEEFFFKVAERLQDALRKISEQLTAEEGYENALFTEDATRGLAFIELCQQRFDVIVMNPPFGAASENTFDYFENNYPYWGRNLVCAFFARMQDMLCDEGKLGAIYDRTVIDRKNYQPFRLSFVCGYIDCLADTGWGVLDANVETSTMVLRKQAGNYKGTFFDLREITDISSKQKTLLASILEWNNGHQLEKVYNVESASFAHLVNAIIGYDIDSHILGYLMIDNFETRGFKARKGHDFHMLAYPRKFYEVVDSSRFKIMYNGGTFNMFYKSYSDVVIWDEQRSRSDSRCNLRNLEFQYQSGTGFGEYGLILDAHVLARDCIFTQEGQAITGITHGQSIISTSFLNSVISQYILNVIHSGLHKVSGYINLLPMPDYLPKQKDIQSLMGKIISIRRYWFSFDETNLEYRGFIARLGQATSLSDAILALQNSLLKDTSLYYSLVDENDSIWVELASIEKDSDFYNTLSEYKKRRLTEELLSIDNASLNGVLDASIIGREIVMELVGDAFGRWDIKYTKKPSIIPEFSDVFEALPFMPVVSLHTIPEKYPIDIPVDGLLIGAKDYSLSIVSHVRSVLMEIWGDRADSIEYELCRLIGFESLQEFFDNPNGFFDYHFKRYTKSRRKAPIYWPLSSSHGAFTVWVYYPRLSQNTLPQIVLLLGREIEATKSELTAAQLNKDRVEENRLRILLTDLEGMVSDLNAIIELPYRPNLEDGVPVTAAPLARFFQHTGWRNECMENLERLNSGEYDWSHLAFSLFPVRIREKAKKDWCMALTHGLEDICVNKPKAKRSKKTKEDEASANLFD